MTVYYEWDVEEVASVESESFETGEVIDHYHQSSYSDCIKFIESPVKTYNDITVEYKICIVRDDDYGRSWAYIEDGKLPEHFEDAYQVAVVKIPKRFHAEVERYK